MIDNWMRPRQRLQIIHRFRYQRAISETFHELKLTEYGKNNKVTRGIMGASRQIQRSITHARTSVLDTLQCGRGLAALGVMITHYSTNTKTFVDPLLPDCPARVFQSFAFGVDFFFVLSGFIILNAHFHENGRSLRIKNYVIKRLSPIYVPYLPITLALIAAYLIFPHFSSTNREWGWVIGLFLFPTLYAPALGVPWSLNAK